MPHGRLTRTMERQIATVIRGREVWDMGAGDLTHARKLVELGASKVIAVDKGYADHHEAPAGIEMVGAYYEHITLPEGIIDVMFLSWPTNTPAIHGLLPLIEVARTVIYLGCNTGGTSCGTPEMWMRLASRSILAHVPNRQNTLIVYGDYLTEGGRKFVLEERGGLFGWDGPWLDYEDEEPVKTYTESLEDAAAKRASAQAASSTH